MNPHKYAFKNYIFDFYGTLVDIETDESSPILWDTMAQIYQSYGASYSGEGLRLRYRELVQQVEEDLAKEKQVAYPEIDLTVIFVQLYLEGHPSGNSVSHLKDLHNRLIYMAYLHAALLVHPLLRRQNHTEPGG